MKHIKALCIITIINVIVVGYAQAASVSLKAKNIVDNTEALRMSFQEACTTDTYKLSEQYIELYYEPDTAASKWNVDIYTNNLNASSSLIQRGGLIGVSTSSALSDRARVPLAWKSSNIVATPETVDMTGADKQGWLYLKDKGDSDDPATSSDESWDGSYNAGYTAVAHGDFRSCVPATFYIYVEAYFKDAPACDYASTIWLDLYQDVDVTPPTIAHNPVSTIVGLGSKMKLQFAIADDEKVDSCTLHYKINTNGDWLSYAGTVSSGTTKSRIYQFTIGRETIAAANNISYWLECSDGRNTASFKNEANPQSVTIATEISFASAFSGEFSVPDGDPDDGNTKIFVPEGALSSPVSITIKQLNPNSMVSAPLRDTKDPDGMKPVAVYEFEPAGQKFSKPIDVTLLFLADQKKVRYPDGTTLSVKGMEHLNIYWYDGFNWRACGGKIDQEKNTITIKTNHFSKYAVFYTPANVADYRSMEKIITPATIDTHNDYAQFGTFGSEAPQIEIFDITGHKVRHIEQMSIPTWDGKDESGRLVESGVYLYQFEAEIEGRKKLISGTIVVAK